MAYRTYLKDIGSAGGRSDEHIASDADLLPKPPRAPKTTTAAPLPPGVHFNPWGTQKRHVGHGLSMDDDPHPEKVPKIDNWLQLKTLSHTVHTRDDPMDDKPIRKTTDFEAYARHAKQRSAENLMKGASDAEMKSIRGGGLRTPREDGHNVDLKSRNAVLDLPSQSHADLHDAKRSRDAAWERHRKSLPDGAGRHGTLRNFLDKLMGVTHPDAPHEDHCHHRDADGWGCEHHIRAHRARPPPSPPPTSFITHEGYKPLTQKGLDRKAQAEADVYEAHHSKAWNRAPPRDRRIVEREAAWKLLNPHDNGIVYDRHGPRVTVKGVAQSRQYTRQALKTAESFRGWTRDANLASGVGDAPASWTPPTDHYHGKLTMEARRAHHHG